VNSPLTQRSDRRNHALHRAAVAKLRGRNDLRAMCLSLCEKWLADESKRPSGKYLERWRDLLTGASDDELAAVVLDPLGGQTLRSCSPLGPVLDPRERWALLRDFETTDPR
jgi:hypothetical protein